MADALEKAEAVIQKSKLPPTAKATLMAVLAVLALLAAAGGFLRPSIVEAMKVETTEAHKEDIERLEKQLPSAVAEKVIEALKGKR